MKKRIVLCTMCLVLALMQLPFGALADAKAAYVPQLRENTEPTHKNFTVACDPAEMLYGIPTAVVDGKTFGFSDKKLYAVSGQTAEVVLNEEGDNINLVDDTIFYTAYENGEAYIKSYNITNKKIETIMQVGDQPIYNFYVVNENTFLYLSDGVVYKADFNASFAEKLDLKADIYNFMPTDSGILYGVGAAYECKLYLDSVLLLEDVNSYMLENDATGKEHLVVKVSGELFQISMAKVRSYCKAKSNVQKNSLLPYLEEYCLHGHVNAAELLNLDDPGFVCEYCEGNSESEEELLATNNCPIEFTRMREEYEVKVIGATAYQSMITNQASELLNQYWTPKANVPKRGSSAYFIKGTTYKGVPYARGTDFPSGIHEKILHVEPGKEFSSSNPMSLGEFIAEVNNSNSQLYSAASAYPNAGPLYGADCSSFVSYAWGLYKHYATGVLPGVAASSYNVSQSSDMNKIAKGDAFVRQQTSSKSGHAVLIYNITYYSSGGINKIKVAEETPPITRTKELTVSEFLSEYGTGTGYVGYKPPRVTITFNYMGGSGTPASIPVIANVEVSEGGVLPIPQRSGYRFLGWSTTSSGSIIPSNFFVTENCTLYARWALTEVEPVSVWEILPSEILCQKRRNERYLNTED